MPENGAHKDTTKDGRSKPPEPASSSPDFPLFAHRNAKSANKTKGRPQEALDPGETVVPRSRGMRRNLALKPCRQHPHQKRDAKGALRARTGGGWQREADCWKKTDLTLLKKCAQNTGLAEYLKEVRQELVPLFTGHRKPR
jgi:hypothetical protein